MKHLLLIIAITLTFTVRAQNQRLLVSSIETNLATYSNDQLTSFTYNFIKYYGTEYTTVNNKRAALIVDSIKNNNDICDEPCLRSVCKRNDITWALSGEMQSMAGSIFVTISMINRDPMIKNKTARMEFLDLPKEAEFMLKLTLQKLLELPQDHAYLSTLAVNSATKSNQVPVYSEMLNLSGPRVGYTVFTGPSATVMQASKSDGGFDMRPGMVNIGYQFEQQYLKGGAYQGLLEFIPQVSGLDQGLFLPSFTIINGLRNSKNGLEFGFGPTFTISKQERKYFAENAWHRPEDRANLTNEPLENKLDSRGTATLKANLIFAVGKSFQAGSMNVPVNLFFVPYKDDYRFGISIGYNFRRASTM